MRALILFLTTLVALLLIAVGFAPTYFSTPSGNETLAWIINSRISGEVSFDKAKISWMGEQSIRNLKLKDHEGAEIVSIEYAETETGLLSLLLTHKPGESMMRKFNAHIVEQPDGTSNIVQALESDIPPPINPESKPLIIDLENVNGMISMGTPNIPKKIHLVGTSKQGDVVGSFNIEIDSHSDDKHMIMEAQIKNFPVAIFDQLIAYKKPEFDNIATTAIGKTFDLEMTNTYRDGTSFFKLDIDSFGLQAELHGQHTNSLLTVTTPSEVALTVTPKLLNYFMDESPIDKSAKAIFVLDQLNIPMNHKWTDLAVKFHLDQEKSDRDVVRYLDGTEVTIDTREGSLPHIAISNDDLNADLLFNPEKRIVSGNLVVQPDTSLSVVAELDRNNELDVTVKGSALNMKAHIQDAGNFRIDASANDFPLASICHYVCFDKGLRHKVEALLGNEFSGNINANVTHWSGNVAVSAKGKNGEFNLDGYLRQGVLKLNQPLTARVQLTEALGREILEELFPLFSGVITSEVPATLSISPENFAIGLNPFTASGVRIDRAELDLNKVIFSNDGELGSILSLLNPNEDSKLLVWFTPLYFSMNEGALKLERIDMLIMDEYPIAAWGKVNFAKDKVGINIGLSARAIEQGFNIENLPQNYMLQLSLKGPLNDAKIDRRKAAAKISSLIAKTQGIEGNLIGTVIDVASGNLRETPPPAPTTDPLPWDLGQTKSKSAPTERKKKMSYILDKVEQGASKIFKGKKSN